MIVCAICIVPLEPYMIREYSIGDMLNGFVQLTLPRIDAN
jgi:hypothetical protein